MGFRTDWSAHWRFMRSEVRAACGAIRARPAQRFFRIFTSPLMFALLAFITTCYFNS